MRDRSSPVPESQTVTEEDEKNQLEVLEEEGLRELLEKYQETPVPIEEPAFSGEMIATRENRENVEIDTEDERANESLVGLTELGISANEKEGKAVLRESVAQDLARIDKVLKKIGLNLHIRSGWRSLEEQQKRKDDWLKEELDKGRDKADAEAEADRRFSDAEPSAPHLSGGAFDVEIHDDMGALPTKPWLKDREGNKLIPDIPDLMMTENNQDLLRALVGHTIGYREGEEYMKDPEAHFTKPENKEKYLGIVSEKLKDLAKKSPEGVREIAEKYAGAELPAEADPKELIKIAADALGEKWDEIVAQMPEVQDKQFRDERVAKIVKNRRLLYNLLTETMGATAHPSEFWHFGKGDRTSAYFSGPDSKAYYDYAPEDMKKQPQEAAA